MFSTLLLMCCLCFHLTAGYFEVHNYKKSYDEASEWCQTYKGTLASLTKDEAENFPSAEQGNELWVGLRRVSGGWLYDNGTELSAEEFADLPAAQQHEPAHYELRPYGGTWNWTDGTQLYLDDSMLGGSTPKWGECGALKEPGLITALNCRRSRSFICEFPDGDDSENTVYVGNFKVSETEADYKQATEYCEENDGRLATLTLAEANTFSSATYGDELWVGVQRVSGGWQFDNGTTVTEEEFAELPYHMQVEPAYYNLRPSGGEYEWSNGTEFDINTDEMWVGGSPDPAYGTCGALNRPGQITALNCRRSRRFICQYLA